MATLIPGFTTEQKTVTVNNDDTDINEAITAQNADNWVVTSLTLSGSNIIILFNRTIPVS